MKNQENRKLAVINICFCAALLLVLMPLLMVSRYNYPSADDWSYGREAYEAIRSGGGLGVVLKISLETAARNYMNWEGRFMNAFFASLQPGIWGEQCYCMVAWLMLGSLVLGEMYFFYSLSSAKSGKNRLLWLPIAAATLTMQILYTPSVVESFYWYTGAVNYTFVFGLSLVLTALFVKLGTGEWRGWKYGIAALTACVLAVVVGGDNFSTSLSTLLLMLVLSLLWLGQNRRAFWRTWYIMLFTGASLGICLMAPGNAKRLEGNFGGSTTGNALGAVITSLTRTFTNIYSWTNIKIVLMLVLILPFVWLAVRNLSYEFRFPGLFTLLSFGIYASQITATVYVDGTTGGGRVAAILYYAYHIWLVGNVCYWTGWLQRMRQKGVIRLPKRLEKPVRKTAAAVRRFLIPYCAVAGGILVLLIYTADLKQLSSYKAYRDWRQGWAQQYAREWEERLEILHDESITEVEFAPLSVYPETILYTDLQDEEGYTWVNKACASYYGKKRIKIVMPRQSEASDQTQ